MKYRVTVFHYAGTEVVKDVVITCNGTRGVEFSGSSLVIGNLEKGVVWKGKKFTPAHGLRFLEAVSLSLSQNKYLSATDIEPLK